MSRPRNFGTRAIARALAEARTYDPVLRRMYGLPLLPVSSLPPSPPCTAMRALDAFFVEGDYDAAQALLKEASQESPDA